MKVLLTQHAESQIELRGLDRDTVIQVARNPEQLIYSDEIPPVAQSRTVIDGKMYLLRVPFGDRVEQDETVRVVITAYRTSQIRKFWQEKP